LEPRVAPFEFEFHGRFSRVKIGESVRIEHSTGFVFKQAECVASNEMRVSVNELNFSWPNKAAFVAQVKYAN